MNYIKILFYLGVTAFSQIILTSCSSTEIVIHNINSEGIYPEEFGESELIYPFVEYLVDTFGDTSSTSTVLVFLFHHEGSPLDLSIATVYDSGGIRSYEVHGFEKFYLKSIEPIHYNEKFVRDVLYENFAEIVKYAGSPVDNIVNVYKINYIKDHFKVKIAFVRDPIILEYIPDFSDFNELKK
ncbi:MAG: hypothetical protein SCALA702_01180 [Melioribacteraceae bacterium]|nr:MAG: hypothetical protein SCALA702_01180 [Melioribacteraceae bacterium]